MKNGKNKPRSRPPGLDKNANGHIMGSTKATITRAALPQKEETMTKPSKKQLKEMGYNDFMISIFEMTGRAK